MVFFFVSVLANLYAGEQNLLPVPRQNLHTTGRSSLGGPNHIRVFGILPTVLRKLYDIQHFVKP